MANSGCSHDITHGGLCVDCGSKIDQPEDKGKGGGGGEDGYMMRPHSLNVRKRVAQSEDRALEMQVRQQKKLFLILDLDNTLIEASHLPDAGMFGKLDVFKSDLHHFQLAVRGRATSHHLKLRPGVEKLLAECEGMFRMYIYTHGKKDYAHEVAKRLDPKGRYFGQGTRILSRETFPEAFVHDVKNLEGLLSCNDRMILILDDRTDVWGFSKNVLKVYPYRFFTPHRLKATKHWWKAAYEHAQKSSHAAGPEKDGGKVTTADGVKNAGRAEGSSGKTTVDGGGDAAGDRPGGDGRVGQGATGPLPLYPSILERDAHLHDVLKLLKETHRRFYAQHGPTPEGPPPNVCDIVDQQRKMVLRGCLVCFSGLHDRHDGIDVAHTAHGQLVRAFGGKCSNDLSDQVTHLICVGQTSKYHKAKSMPQVKIVKYEWLLDCTWGWTRHPEEAYASIPTLKPEELVDLRKAPLALGRVIPPPPPSRSRKRERSPSPSSSTRNVRPLMAQGNEDSGNGEPDMPPSPSDESDGDSDEEREGGGLLDLLMDDDLMAELDAESDGSDESDTREAESLPGSNSDDESGESDDAELLNEIAGAIENSDEESE